MEVFWGRSHTSKGKYLYLAAGNKLSSNSFFNHSRNMELSAFCTICDGEHENSFHALCRCPLVVLLWKAMAECCSLTDVAQIRNTGTDWILHIVCELIDSQRLNLFMLLWRIWYIQNEVVHVKPAPPWDVSKRFLCSYVFSILHISQAPVYDPVKGKVVCSRMMTFIYRSFFFGKMPRLCLGFLPSTVM